MDYVMHFLTLTQVITFACLVFGRQRDGGRLPPLPQRQPRPLHRALWGHWSGYGPCSRTCGQGVKMRTRRCLQWTGQRYTETHLTACKGINIDYKLCEHGPCSHSDEDFRAYQCRILSKTRQIDGNIHIWKPHNHGKACELTCKTVGTEYMYNFGTVQDGTPCLNSLRHVCVHGQCKVIGCDGHIGDSDGMDQCGVCHGRNDSCHKISSSYKVPLPDRANRYRGYNEVTAIPRGATNVHVTQSSKNNLALMSDDQRFILNGHYTLNKPGMYNIHGTMILYDRDKNGSERLQSDGPTTQGLRVMLYYREHNRGVDYEYWVPGNASNVSDTSKDINKNALPVDDVTIQPRYRYTVTETPSSSTTTTTQASLVRHTQSTASTTHNYNLSDDEIWDMVVTEVQRRNKKKQHPKRKQAQKAKRRRLDKSVNKTKNRIARRKNKTKKRKGKKRKFLSKEKCGQCKKVRKRNKQFCASDFVSKVRVNGVEIFGNATRYDITILYTYRNIVPLLHREYLWVYSLCKCPRLRVRREYIVMGMMEYHGRREIRLSVSSSSFVRQFNIKYNHRMEKLKRKRSKCKVQKKKFR